MNAKYPIEITQRLNAIEGLKSQLLMDIAQLYTYMASHQNVHHDQYMDLFSDLIVLTYLLSKHMDTDFHELDRHIINKLKISLLDDTDRDRWIADLKELLVHFTH